MDHSRRNFLRWIGVAPAGSLLLLHGCGNAATRQPRDDAGMTDSGQTSADAGSTNGGTNAGTADMGSPDTGASTDAETMLDDAGTDTGSDASMPTDTGETCEPTGSDVEGPFHIDGAPNRTVLADAEEPGDRIVVEGTVYGPPRRSPARISTSGTRTRTGPTTTVRPSIACADR